MKGLKTVYICENCEYKSPKWLGKCPSCGEWNTFVEDVVEATPSAATVKRTSAISSGSVGAVAYKELSLPDFIKVIREVSGNKTYSNHSMARKFPEELI